MMQTATGSHFTSSPMLISLEISQAAEHYKERCFPEAEPAALRYLLRAKSEYEFGTYQTSQLIADCRGVRRPRVPPWSMEQGDGDIPMA